MNQWTWAATILQSSNVAWQYGVSGPFWYASGATVQLLLFGVMAIEIKRKAPNAHTVCEIVKARCFRKFITYFAYIDHSFGQLIIGFAISKLLDFLLTR